MVEPELAEAGELHSLTDGQVSEASEEAELDGVCDGGRLVAAADVAQPVTQAHTT